MGEREGEPGHGAVGEEERVGGVVGYSVGEGSVRLRFTLRGFDGWREEYYGRADRERQGVGF